MTWLLLLTALSAAPSPADTLFEKGRAAFEAGKLTEALEAFEQAHRIKPAPELLLNIAQCNRGLGRRAEAISALEAFLLEAPKHPLRKAAEGTLSDLRAEQPADVPLKVALVPAPAPPVPVVVQPAPERRAWPWVVAGAGVAVVAAAIAIGVVASSGSSPYPDLGTVKVPPPR